MLGFRLSGRNVTVLGLALAETARLGWVGSDCAASQDGSSDAIPAHVRYLPCLPACRARRAFWPRDGGVMGTAGMLGSADTTTSPSPSPTDRRLLRRCSESVVWLHLSLHPPLVYRRQSTTRSMSQLFSSGSPTESSPTAITADTAGWLAGTTMTARPTPVSLFPCAFCAFLFLEYIMFNPPAPYSSLTHFLFVISSLLPVSGFSLHRLLLLSVGGFVFVLFRCYLLMIFDLSNVMGYGMACLLACLVSGGASLSLWDLIWTGRAEWAGWRTDGFRTDE